MQYQCPQCYSYEVVVARPKSIFVWIAPILVVDAAILAIVLSGAVENSVVLIIALVVADMLLTLPLVRAIIARNRQQGGPVYRCTSCGHQWTDDGQSMAPATYATPSSPSDPSDFQMTVEDVFSIKGRGTVVTGRVASGAVAVGEAIELHGANGIHQTVVDGIEMFRRTLPRAEVGNNVGILLRGVGKDDVQRGDVLKKGNW